MKLKTRSWLTVMLATVLTGTLLTASVRADVIMDWNARADAIAAQAQVGPFPHGRILAMMHVAMFEAVNAIERRYAPYKLKLTAEAGASKDAAAAAAGYYVLLAAYPDRRAELDGAYVAMLAGVADGDAKNKGAELGKKAAAEIIALRADDRADAPESYRPVTTPGVYLPTVIPAGSTQGAATPWTMTSGSQFRPSAPPALTSETWTKDFNEIREIGRRDSKTRTAEQTTIGRFWFLVGPRTYNPIVRQVAMARDMDIVDCARLYALTAMAGFDAQIAVFDGKYTYNLWRPLTAIRNADQTNNPATPRDATWLPLGDTPMHPEYPCAHCIVSASVSAVLQSVVGNEVGDIFLTSPTASGVTRKWTRLQDYNEEVALARIYAGFHYRFSTVVGKDMGKKIADQLIANQLRKQ